MLALTALLVSAKKVNCHVESLISRGYSEMEMILDCPNCKSPNCRSEKKPKEDNFKQKKAKLFVCRECGYKWYMIISFGGK
jgi:transposase-like protein